MREAEFSPSQVLPLVCVVRTLRSCSGLRRLSHEARGAGSVLEFLFNAAAAAPVIRL